MGAATWSCAESSLVLQWVVFATNVMGNVRYAIATFDLQPSFESVTNALLAITRTNASYAVERYVLSHESLVYMRNLTSSSLAGNF